MKNEIKKLPEVPLNFAISGETNILIEEILLDNKKVGVTKLKKDLLPEIMQLGAIHYKFINKK